MTRELIAKIRTAQLRIQQVTDAIRNPRKRRALPGMLTGGDMEVAGIREKRPADQTEHDAYSYKENITQNHRQAPVPGLKINQWQHRKTGAIQTSQAYFPTDHPFVSGVDISSSDLKKPEVRLILREQTRAPDTRGIRTALAEIGYEVNTPGFQKGSYCYDIQHGGRSVGRIEFGQNQKNIYLESNHAFKIIRRIFQDLDAPRPSTRQVKYLRGRPSRDPDAPRTVKFLRRN